MSKPDKSNPPGRKFSFSPGNLKNKMIDTELIAKARIRSEAILRVDSSWRDYVKKVKEGIFSIPFPGAYECRTLDNILLVEGYKGLLLIDKLFYDHKTYFLKTPIKYYPFRIFGAYDKTGSFLNFASEPEIGFHYLGLSENGHSICTGDIQYLNPESFGLLKEACAEIIRSFRVVNLTSIGTVLLPDHYPRLKAILSGKDVPPEEKFKNLKKEKLIEEIL